MQAVAFNQLRLTKGIRPICIATGVGLFFATATYLWFSLLHPTLNNNCIGPHCTDEPIATENPTSLAYAAAPGPLFSVNVYEVVREKFLITTLKTAYGKTPIAIYKPSEDIYVSQSIWQRGVWEADIMRAWQHVVKQLPNATAIDIGANLGEYGLAAALIGRHTIMVEPLVGSVRRIVRSVQLGRLENKCTVLHNAVSSKQQLVVVKSHPRNLGGSYVQTPKLGSTKKGPLVQTILLDDLIDLVVTTDIVIKIDVECHEFDALHASARIFSKFRVKYIFMEWHIRNCGHSRVRVWRFVKRMLRRKFVPYKVATIPRKKLLPSDCMNWPEDIMWVSS